MAHQETTTFLSILLVNNIRQLNARSMNSWDTHQTNQVKSILVTLTLYTH